MGLQQLYDDICSHLDRQGYCSVDEKGNCRYRGGEGAKCAIGGVLPDNIYCENMESRNTISLLKDPQVREYFTKSYGNPCGTDLESLLYNSQRVHDRTFTEEWAMRFKTLAEVYSLIPFTFTHPNIVGE